MFITIYCLPFAICLKISVKMLLRTNIKLSYIDPLEASMHFFIIRSFIVIFAFISFLFDLIYLILLISSFCPKVLPQFSSIKYFLQFNALIFSHTLPLWQRHSSPTILHQFCAARKQK